MTNAHNMRTYGKVSIRQPIDHLNRSMAALSLVPTTFRTVLSVPNCRTAMQAEFNVLQAKNTWTLVPCPSNDEPTGRADKMTKKRCGKVSPLHRKPDQAAQLVWSMPMLEDVRAKWTGGGRHNPDQ
jgi:hypothetical protein